MQQREAILHTGILKYSEHMESIEKQLKSLQTGHTHTHTQIQMKSPQIFCIQNCNHYKCNIYYNNIIDQQPLSLSCNAAKDPLN